MAMTPPVDAPANDLTHCKTPQDAVSRLCTLYDDAIVTLQQQFARYMAGEAAPDPASAPVYPYLCARVPAEAAPQTSALALGRVAETSLHGATVTQPSLFRGYFERQLSYIIERYQAEIFVGRSFTPIPLSFGLESATVQLTQERRNELQFHFHTPNLVATNDDIVDGQIILKRSGPLPLSMFSAERVDYSLHRIQHYTATRPDYTYKSWLR